MSYQFYITPAVIVSNKLMDLMFELKARDTDHLIKLIEEKYSVHAEKDWTQGYERLEVRSLLSSPEHEGLDGIASRLAPTLFSIADAGNYTIVDEYDRELTVTVQH